MLHSYMLIDKTKRLRRLSYPYGVEPRTMKLYGGPSSCITEEVEIAGSYFRSPVVDRDLVQRLCISPTERTNEDIHVIYLHLRTWEAFTHLREPQLRQLCYGVRYECRESNDIIYCRGEICSCWYVLLSGSVFIDGSMYLPRSSFGKRTARTSRRSNECLVLEPSEMIAVDYPDVQFQRVISRHSPSSSSPLEYDESSKDASSLHSSCNRHVMNSLDETDGGSLQIRNHHPHPWDTHHAVDLVRAEPYIVWQHRCSRGSDTSSDTMPSLPSSSQDDADVSGIGAGLVESVVDSDEDEDMAESIDSLTVRDAVRECLEKHPQERTDDDIEVLLEFMQHLLAFANMTLAVRRALCAVMVFAVVDKSGTVVMNDGEELDSWSVIVNGHVEIDNGAGEVKELHLGDSFGITPTMEKLYHQGVMRTKMDDCQFVCITQGDYYRILHQGEENTKRHEEDGEVVLVTEQRVLEAGNRQGHIVIRGTPDRLMSQLVEENSLIDPTYVEDFLLTHRTFMSVPLQVTTNLLTWFNDPVLRDRVTRVVLLWVNNHFPDFETDNEMMDFLEAFEGFLERERMQGQLRLLNIACAAKARSRTVTLARSTRDEVLHFSLLGGYERGFCIFIAKVDKKSKAEDVGLKRGDQILEVNGQSFEHMTHARALEILRSTTHLSITVKSNLLAFKEMLTTPDNSPRSRGKKVTSELARLQNDPKARLSTQIDFMEAIPGVLSSALTPTSSPVKGGMDKEERKGFMTLGHKTRLKKALMKMITKSLPSDSHLNTSDDSLYTSGSISSCSSSCSSHPASSGTSSLYQSHSNPDLTSLHASFYYDTDPRTDYPEHVLKVYRADQSCKYLLIHKETTAREVVMLSLREFGVTDPSNNYSLCEVTVGEGGVIKQRRLPDQLQNLAERIGLNSRYYLRNNTATESLVPDELAVELMRENQVHFLQLNSIEVAIQLTLQDFSIFRQIEPTEYIDDLFNLKSKYGTPMLDSFSRLVNREMFWVVTEVCSEHNPIRRMKIVKQFIKVARHCKDCKNFNTMFAVLSGLGHGAVSRLRSTWDKLSSKYQKLYNDLTELMDPSRNMSKYRNLINNEHIQPPIIPFYPVVKKDLTFIHLGNDSRVDSLVNFEKLRMISKEIRQLCNMCSAPYDLFSMVEPGGVAPNPAMVSMNQLTMGGVNIATFKRRKKSTAVPNPKKMFEEAQMVRRVKSYLGNLKVTENEDRLHQMSIECEAAPSSSMIPPAVASVVRRRNPSPTLSTTSSTSSTSEGRKVIACAAGAPKFGTESPHAVRKMLALSEQAKLRPHQPLRQSSPSRTSPHSSRRGRDPRPGHGRSHSDTVQQTTVLPVDLTTESSSVTSLNSIPLRKSHTSGSVTSSDSSLTQPSQTYDNDSGVQFDSHSNHSNSSAGSTNSPPAHRKHGGVSPPAVMRKLSAPAPPFSHVSHVLPSISQLPGLPMVPPPPPPRDSSTRPRKPPDYTLATQALARNRSKLVTRGRAHSLEGGGSMTGYYSDDATDPEDDEEGTQVSAV